MTAYNHDKIIYLNFVKKYSNIVLILIKDQLV